MEIPNHFFHPFLIHIPIVLPFVCLFFICLKRCDLESVRAELLVLLGLQVVVAACAYYSGVWSSDGIAGRLSLTTKSHMEWHYFYGRLVVLGSALAFIFGAAALMATQHKKVFYYLSCGSIVCLCLLVVLSGYTGGELVHEYEVNRLF